MVVRLVYKANWARGRYSTSCFHMMATGKFPHDQLIESWVWPAYLLANSLGQPGRTRDLMSSVSGSARLERCTEDQSKHPLRWYVTLKISGRPLGLVSHFSQ